MPPNLRRPLLPAGGFLTDVLGCLYGLVAAGRPGGEAPHENIGFIAAHG